MLLLDEPENAPVARSGSNMPNEETSPNANSSLLAPNDGSHVIKWNFGFAVVTRAVSTVFQLG